MKLTREEIAKVISLYLFSNVYYRDYTYCQSEADYEKENNHELNYLRFLTPSALTTSHSGSIVSRDVSKIKLLLTPLSAITDEQILELCKVYAPTIFGDYRYNKWAIEQDGVKSDTWDVVNIKRKNDGYVFQLDKIDGELRLYDEDMLDTSSVNHYYQQWYFQNRFAIPLFFGIDHPDNGKSAIDLGIAIIKQ